MTTNEEKPVSKRLRYEVLRRDNHTCRYCGGTAPDVKLHVDHVLPIALGGTNVAENLVAACADCNIGKAATSTSEAVVGQVSADAHRWAIAVRAASEVFDGEYQARTDYINGVAEEWSVRRWVISGREYPKDDNWEHSMGVFFDRRLPLSTVRDSIRISHNAGHIKPRDKWRYFMGVCWKRLTEIEELAKQLYDIQTKKASGGE